MLGDASIRAEMRLNDQELFCRSLLSSLCGLECRTTRGSADEFTADQAVGSLGRIDGSGFYRGDQACAGRLPVAVRHHGEAWATYAAWHRSDQCALRVVACGGESVCRGLPGV